MSEPQIINLNLDYNQLRETGLVWARRASIFLGLGSNAAKASPPLSHVMDSRVQYILVPPDPAPELKEKFLEEFEVWVIANGLRELVEGYSTFLRNAHSAAFIVSSPGGKVSYGDHQSASAAFERRNVAEQSTELCQMLGIENAYEKMFESFRRARNCLAHRNGVVGPVDVGSVEGDSLEIRWRFPGMKTGHGEDAKYLDLNDHPDGYRVGPGTPLLFGPVWRRASR